MGINKKQLGLLFILLSGLVLRLIALNQSLWLDEGIEWWGVTSFDLRKLLTGYMLGDFNPPGHHLLMWFWVRIFGDSEVALRMPSVLFGVGTVGMAYKISEFIFQNSDSEEKDQKASTRRNFLGTVLGVLQGPSFPSILAATNGLLIYYSQEARMYAMATFFVTASVWAFLRLQLKFSFQMFTTYYLLLTTALYSHYLTWLMIPVFVISGFRKIGVVRSIAPIVATIPLLPLLVKQIQNGIASAGNSQWAMLSQTNPKNIALVFVKFVTGRVPFPDQRSLQVAVGLLIALFWVGVFRGVIRILKDTSGKREKEHPELLIILWATVPLFLGAMIGLSIPVFTYFRFLFVVPAVVLLFARGITDWNPRVVGGFMIIIFLSFSLQYLLNPLNHREDWRRLVEELARRDVSPTVAIFSAVRPPFDYYDRGRSSVMPAELLRVRERFAADPELETIWVIPYGWDIFDAEGKIPQFLMTFSYRRVFERHFRGVTIEKWERNIEQ